MRIGVFRGETVEGNLDELNCLAVRMIEHQSARQRFEWCVELVWKVEDEFNRPVQLASICGSWWKSLNERSRCEAVKYAQEISAQLGVPVKEGGEKG